MECVQVRWAVLAIGLLFQIPRVSETPLVCLSLAVWKVRKWRSRVPILPKSDLLRAFQDGWKVLFLKNRPGNRLRFHVSPEWIRFRNRPGRSAINVGCRVQEIPYHLVWTVGWSRQSAGFLFLPKHQIIENAGGNASSDRSRDLADL